MISQINYITALISFNVTIEAILQFYVYISRLLCIICNNKKNMTYGPMDYIIHKFFAELSHSDILFHFEVH